MANIRHMAENDARYTRTISDQQREAILKAALVDGHKPHTIRKMAAAGQLGVPAFTLSTYVYKVIERGRETYEDLNHEALAQGTRRELQRLHKLNLARSRQLTDKTDPTEVARIAKALAETQRAMNTNTAKPPVQAKRAPQPEDAANTAQGANVVTDLLAKAGTKAGTRTGSVKRASIPGQASGDSTLPDVA